MDLSKFYAKTSELASNAAKTSRKFMNQARDLIDDSSTSLSTAISNVAPGTPTQFLQSQSQVELPPNMRINGMEITFIKLLDEGGFSYVFDAIDTRTGTPLAVKKLLVQDQETAKSVRMEIKIMQDLKNEPNIIDILGTLEQQEGSKRVFYIVMEKAKMSLVQVMQHRLDIGKRFSQTEVLTIFHCICSGVESMHRQDPPVQHRDLKVENVLRAGNTFKLCDFGSATTRVYSLDSKSERSQAEEDIAKHTTLAYRSPEMCDLYSEFPITEKSDIWALGCILFKLCYFIGPFDEAAAEGSFLPIINCKYVIPKEPKVSPEILNFVKEMLEINVEKRPDIWDVLDRLAQLLGVKNAITRPSHCMQNIKKQRSTSNIVQVKAKKKQDLFDLLGGEDVKANTSTSTSKKETNKTPSPNQAPSQNFSFEDNDDWEANFDDSDSFSNSNKSSNPISSKPSMPVTPQKNSSSLFDELDWQPSTNSPTQSNTSARSTSSTPTTTPQSGTSLDIDFSGLTIHTPSKRNEARNNILQTMDLVQSQSSYGMHGRVNSFDASNLQRPHTPQSPSIYTYYTPPSSPYPHMQGYPQMQQSMYHQSHQPQQSMQQPMYPMQHSQNYPQYFPQMAQPQPVAPPSPAQFRDSGYSSSQYSPSPQPTTPSINPFDEFF